ncbi:hypothetical protein UFOVP791_9 [uncultured Caudovirales phage]|uniref:Uncharacterized protein n=1 Tax=uncultured Caudovirales phage TaxID=2100421 RepID=A0A6J5NSE9_9CAUD|nr:hypothetical protein UFOVP791_9 [uncultured Caudovirales phage]
MALPATLSVTINFSDGPVFGSPFTIGDPVYGKLGGVGTLGATTTPALILDVTAQTVKIDTRRGRNINQDLYEAGTAVIRVLDPNGDFNPQNTSSPYYTYLQPLRKVRITADNGTAYNIFSGYTTDYRYTYPVGQDIAYVDISCVDGFRLFNMSNITTITDGTASQATGTRLGKILDMVSWPTSMRSIATGNSTCQVSSVDNSVRSVLQACRNVEQSEYGAFYCDPNGVAVFKSRSQVLAAAGTSPTVFNQDGSGINYANVTFAFDDKQVVNNVSVQRTGGTAQVASDATSITTYFTHSLSYSNLIVETDAEAMNIAKAYVASHKDTTIRIDSMTLDLMTANYTAGVTAALDLDYFDQVQITNTQPAGSTITKTLQVQGIAHAITPNTWKTTLTTQEPIIDGFIIGSSLYGILGTSVLAY